MRSARSAIGAAAAYSVLTLAMTWPLAAGLTRDVPADFGDPLLNMWILAWSARHPANFDAPIFYPHPLALAYSDHLTPQALGIWPVLAATGNIVLAYNVLFLATFVISGLGAFLLVRDLAGDTPAAFAAGAAFAFAPYRFASTPHVQVLSSMWMPFAILGYRRFLATGASAPLAGGALAWTAQNLSCGYYLFFFSPAVVIYVLWDATVRRLWTRRRTVLMLAGSAIAMAAATVPFLLPYARLRRLGFMPRSLAEVQKYSADVYAWLTADPHLAIWGRLMDAWPRAEGALFPGVTIALLAAIGAATAWRAPADGAPAGREQRALRAAAFAAGVVALALLLGFRLRIPNRHPVFSITGFERALVIAAALTALWLARAPRSRRAGALWLRSPAAPFTAIALFAAVMSFGPAIFAGGRVVVRGAPYAAFYRGVPGVDGLRVPARFGMVAAFGLAVLAGLAMARLGASRPRRVRLALASAATILVCGESLAVPLAINENDTVYRQSHLAPLPGRLDPGLASSTYRFVHALPAGQAIVELPLGEPAFDVRYMFHAIWHGHPLVNGYSGGAPPDYGLLAEALSDLPRGSGAAWRALRRTGAAFAIVHESAYSGSRGQAISAALAAAGAREVAAFGTDRIFRIQ